MDNPDEKNKMYWYHWVAIYGMMAAVLAFWVIPEKTIWMGIVIVAVGVGGYLVIAKLPRKDTKDLD